MMSLLEAPNDRRGRLVRAAARADIAALDRDREIRAAAEVMVQVEVAKRVHLSQARVSQIIQANVADPPPGFSGASPKEIAQRFAAGELSEMQAIDELGRWEYAEPAKVDPYDDVWEPGDGTWVEVTDALHEGLITDAVYEGARALRRTRQAQD
jgi:hypothetical protein